MKLSHHQKNQHHQTQKKIYYCIRAKSNNLHPYYYISIHILLGERTQATRSTEAKERDYCIIRGRLLLRDHHEKLKIDKDDYYDSYYFPSTADSIMCYYCY